MGKIMELHLYEKPTKDMPTEGFPYRLFCHLCGKTIMASEVPIPIDLQEFLEGTPCSECISPEDYLKELEKE